MMDKTNKVNEKLKEKEKKGSNLIERLLLDLWPIRNSTNMNKEICVEHLNLNISEIVFIIANEFYEYEGSSSEPPCRENVNWIIYKEAVFINVEIMKKLK